MYRGEPRSSTCPVIDLDFNSAVSDSRIHTRSRTKSTYTISPPGSSSTGNSSSIPLNSPIRHSRESHQIQSSHSATGGLSHPTSLMNPCVSIPPRSSSSSSSSRVAITNNAVKPHLLASRPPRWTDEEVSRRHGTNGFQSSSFDSSALLTNIYTSLYIT